MKFKFIYTLFFLGLAFFLFTSSENGRAGDANWGNTGAPGDQLTTSGQPRVCQSCHNSSAIQVTQTFEITDADGNSITDDGYIPEQLYDVKLTVNTAAGNPAAFGFQILCLNAPEDVMGPEASNWTAVSSNVQVATASNTSRTYVEQPSPSTSNEFLMTWKAPAAGSGEVTFYVVSNGVNLNGMTAGDGSTGGRLNLTENMNINTNDLSSEVDLTIYPNPVIDQLNLRSNTTEAGTYDWSIINLLGATVQSGTLNIAAGSNNHTVEINNALPASLYTLQLSKDEKTMHLPLVKK